MGTTRTVVVTGADLRPRDELVAQPGYTVSAAPATAADGRLTVGLTGPGGRPTVAFPKPDGRYEVRRPPRRRERTAHPETARNAGLVVTRRVRETGTLVSVYRADEAGIESDPEIPWATVCETHNAAVCHPTRALALDHLVVPSGWCLQCRVAVIGVCDCGFSGTHPPGEGNCELAEEAPDA